MGGRTKTAEENRHIPIDLLTENILPWIPVLHLFKNFRHVSKELLQLISSPKFIPIHLKKSHERSKSGSRFLITLPDGVVDYDGGATTKIPYPPGFSGCCSTILGSCDGLICLVDKDIKKVSVFNPSTREYQKREAKRFLWLSWFKKVSWFGRHPCTGEYVLVVGSEIRPQGGFIVVVYKFSSPDSCFFQQRGWRGFIFFDAIGTLLHGVLHWPAYIENRAHHVVFAYDFRRNEIMEIPAPGEFPFTLGVAGECLFAIFRNADKVFELWTMREYGVDGSWTKYANIEGFDCNFQLLVPLGFSSNGNDLIVDADGMFLSKYSFRDKAITVLETERLIPEDSTRKVVRSVTATEAHKFDKLENCKTFAFADSFVSPHLMYN
ncbi:hypothetical protein ABFS82_14G037000 [Erythranthe guttata]|uniref:uncharacterized protein LOC105963297 n=1 Tax=Erythranthe guttata TaxID=4155 RepID=UPI00064DB181|nr:PREDICTED: uncharacterized protein LOC105963297 [Erythranthe guttata]|eukprot:XP_012843144.1 PREDICTED: uncharacterized protein LOC105963297 [Erythranthe guttata]